MTGRQPSPAIAGLTPYRVPRHPAPLDLLLDGIGGLPTDPSFFDALSDADPSALVQSYPAAAGLQAAWAARLGVSPDRLIVTCGGDDALDRACRALLAPGRSIVLPAPTFEMIARYATWAGAEIREVAWPGGAWPLQAVLDAADATTAVVAVVSPNNPTGAVATADQLRALSAALPDTVLLVDLAYVEFADDDPTALVASLPNAVGFRTLSKAWGLAGLRVGCAFGPADVIGWMRAAGNPYTVSGPSLHLAQRWMAAGDDRVRAYVASVRARRDALGAVLRDLGCDPQPSQANFVFARTPRAGWIRDALAGLGIGVRTWPGHPTLADAVRINVPPDDATFDRVVHALRTALDPEAILLDMDGVVAEVSGSYRACIVQTAAHFGATVTAADVRAIKAEGDANNDWKVTHRLLARAGVDVPYDDVVATFEGLYQGKADTPGLEATETAIVSAAALRALCRGRRVAVVTGRPRADAVRFLARHGMADLVEAMVCMEDGPAKPDPFPVREALRLLGVSRAWMVGDTVDDVRAARAAGVVPLGVVPPGESVDTVSDTLRAAGAARAYPTVTGLEELP